MNLDLEEVVSSLPGLTVPRPGGEGAISGHAAGEPFDKLITTKIAEQFTGRTFRQYAALNRVLSGQPAAKSAAERVGLLGPIALQQLLKRGKAALLSWSPEKLFEEKQDDTADIIVFPTAAIDFHVGPVHLLDAKTYQAERAGQPPNIISSRKLAEMCKNMLDSRNFHSHDITYLSVSWRLEDALLKVLDARSVYLFSEDPDELYINWAAAMQVQFHPHACKQTFDGSVEEWCRAYLRMFVASAQKRVARMENDYVAVYLPYV